MIFQTCGETRPFSNEVDYGRLVEVLYSAIASLAFFMVPQNDEKILRARNTAPGRSKRSEKSVTRVDGQVVKISKFAMKSELSSHRKIADA